MVAMEETEAMVETPQVGQQVAMEAIFRSLWEKQTWTYSSL
jgi:hypothetical protein